MNSIVSSLDDASRFSPITPEDHAGYLWIVTALGFSYTTLSFLLRLYIKWGKYGWDDALIAVATAVHLGESISIFDGLASGLAKFNSITTEHSWVISGKAFFASELLSITALCLSKCSVVAMMLRLWTKDVDSKAWVLCLGTLVLSTLWGLGSILGLAVDCEVSRILTNRQDMKHCPHEYARWQAITAMDVITDLIICLIPVILTWPLTMPVKSKLQVVIAFSLRVGVVPISALHLSCFKDYVSSPEPQFAVSDSLLFQQTMITFSLISATMPNLKAFMVSFHSGMGLPGLRGSVPEQSTGYELRTFGRSSGRRPSWREGILLSEDMEENAGGQGFLRPDSVHHEATAHHAGDAVMAADGQSLISTGSQELIIRKEVEWNVRHERR